MPFFISKLSEFSEARLLLKQQHCLVVWDITNIIQKLYKKMPKLGDDLTRCR